MKTERIIWGLIFLFIGGVLLLDNFEVIDFRWETVWHFWPVILIIIGANMLFSRQQWGFVAILVTLAALVFIGYKGVQPESSREIWSYRDETDTSDADEDQYSSNTFSESYAAGITRAELNIQGGATQYTLEDSTSQLFQADVRRSLGNYSLYKTSRDSMEVLNFRMTGKSGWEMKTTHGNKAVLKLNTRPIWDINLEVGAGKIDFDLSAFQVRNLKFEGGAASLDIKLGQPQPITTVTCKTGASKIKIAVPESAACQIKVDSGLSSNDFEGFNKQEDGTFTTPNFNTSNNKIIINLEGGLSKFEVKRY